MTGGRGPQRNQRAFQTDAGADQLRFLGCFTAMGISTGVDHQVFKNGVAAGFILPHPLMGKGTVQQCKAGLGCQPFQHHAGQGRAIISLGQARTTALPRHQLGAHHGGGGVHCLIRVIIAPHDNGGIGGGVGGNRQKPPGYQPFNSANGQPCLGQIGNRLDPGLQAHAGHGGFGTGQP